MAASTYLAQVQQLYIAYFGRPADPIGQAYWAGIIDAAGGNIAAVQAGFSASAESQALFGNKSTIDKVTAIYQNAFGRAPEPAGLSYWVAQLDSGKVTQAQASWTIQQSAGAGDAAAVQNKLTAAQAFTAQIDTTAEIQGYQGAGAAAAGVAFLATVNQNNATATAAVAAAPSALAAAVAAGGTAGTTTAFTASVDSLVGTANNDTFVGIVGTTGATLGAADSVNGGAGVDTLRIVATTGAAATNLLAGVTVTNVEKLAIQNTAATAVTAVAPTGVTTVSSVNSTGNVAFTGLAAGTEVILSGASTAALNVLNFAQATPTDAVKVTIDGGVNNATVAATAGAATSAAINSTGAANGATTADTITLTAAGASLTTLTVNADTSLRANLTVGDFATAGAALTVTGAAAVNLGNNGIYKTVDASASTGGLTIGLNAVTTSFKGSTGNDVVGGTIASTATVDAGAGIDTIVATSINVGNSAVFKNFEQIELGGATTSLDAALLTGSTITGVTVSGVVGDGFALSNLVENASGFNVGITADAGIHVVGGVNVVNAYTLGFTAASVAGTSDVLNYNFSAANAATATTINGGNVTSTGIETINISSKGGLNISNALTVTDNTAKSIVITGDHALALTVTAQTGTAGTTSQLTSIDGSAATAGLNITTSAATTAATAGLTIKGGAGNDTIAVATSGVATSVAPTITTGAGNDTVVVTAATVQAGGASSAFATITDFAKGDALNFGSAITFASTKVDVSAATSFAAALGLATTTGGASTAAGTVSWFTYGTDTYVIDNVDGAIGAAGNDIVVKLNGVLDLSKSTTLVANTVTFA